MAKITSKVRRLNSLKLWSAITGVALVIALLLTFLPMQVSIDTGGMLSIGLRQASANPDWLSGWDYRKAINITGQSGAGTGYQVKFDIGFNASGDFGLEGHCTDFPNDITFTDNDGTTELDYWLEDVTGEYLLTHNASYTQSGNPTWHIDYINDADIIGDYAYCAAYQSNTLTILDISDPENVSEVSSIACSTAHDIQVVDDVAYVVGYLSNTFYSFNISNVENPSLLDSISIGDVGMYLWVEGNYCYLTTRDADWMKIYDISDPSDITYVSGISGATAHLSQPWHLEKVGDYVYITTKDAPYDGISIIDVSTIGSPTYAGGIFGESGKYFSMDFRIKDNLLFAGSWAGTYGLMVYNITDGGANVALYSSMLDSETKGQAQHLDISGDYLYIRGEDPEAADNGISVLNIADPANPYYVCGLYGAGSPYYMYSCHWVQVVGDICYTVGFNADSFVILNIEAGYANVWVEVADDLSSGTVPIYCYYGKSGQSTSSNGTATFIHFDDFEWGSDGDPITDSGGSVTWSLAAGDVDITTDQYYSSYGNRSMELLPHASYSQATALVTAGESIAIRARVRLGTRTTPYDTQSLFITHGKEQGATDHAGTVLADGYGNLQYYDGAYQTVIANGATTLAWTLWETNDYNWTANQFDWWYEGSEIKADAGMRTGSSWNGIVNFQGSTTTYSATSGYIDDFIVRKYVATEPAFSSAGAEEGYTTEIINTPDNWDFGVLQVSGTSNTTINYFTLNNTGNCIVDVTIQGTNMIGGGYTWVLSGNATPGNMIYGLKAGLDDVDDLFDVVVNTTANAFISDLPEATAQAWGLKIWAPTSYDDGNLKTGSATLTAYAS